MTFEHDKTFIDAGGAHHRGSVTLALIGPQKVSIQWAVNVMSVFFPVNAARGLSVYPHQNLDLARELAVEAWLTQKTPMESEHLFIWPAEMPLAWDGIVRAMGAGENLALGNGSFCLVRGKVPDAGPWFERVGDCVVLRDCDWRSADFSSQKEALAPRPDGATVDPGVITSVCIPSLGLTSLLWTAHALQLQAPVASIKYLAVMIGYEVGIARQRLVDATFKLEPCPEYILFLGDDNVPPASGLQMLMESMRTAGCDAVCGLYHMKSGMDPAQPLAWRSDTPGMLICGRDYKPGELVEVDGTGLDFALIRTRALAQMLAVEGPPLFKTGLEHIPGRGIMIHTEDSYFWEKYVRITGQKPRIDTRCLVGHYDAVSGAVY